MCRGRWRVWPAGGGRCRGAPHFRCVDDRVTDEFLNRLRQALAPEFSVDRPLGQGGMGIVLLAREVSLGKRVAIKTIRPELATAVMIERFRREAKTLAGLSHPNIVPVHRLLTRDGLPFL